MEDLGFEDLDKYLLNQNGKIIHQIWFGTIPNKKTAKKAFEGLRKYRDSWLIENPSWTYVCWNLSRCKDLVRLFYGQHKEMYDKYQYQGQDNCSGNVDMSFLPKCSSSSSVQLVYNSMKGLCARQCFF